MVLTCPTCGALSRDLEFCDHCNADLAPRASSPQPPPFCRLADGTILTLSSRQQAHLQRPEAAIETPGAKQCWRLHWIGDEHWTARAAAVEARQARQATPLPQIDILPASDGRWVVARASGRRATPWLQPPAATPLDELRRLVAFTEALARMLADLRAAGLQWLTFDPAELEYGPDGVSLRITNLDLQAVVLGECPPTLRLNPQFAPPEVCRFNSAAVGPATDVYHLALLAYYWVARLLPGGFLGKGLEAFDHCIPPLRIYAPALAPGIAPVIERALAVDPGQRPADAVEFCRQLRDAIDQAAVRLLSTAELSWDIGGHTRTGRTKESIRRPNEDAVFARQFTDPDRALVAVADGITTCDVGTGALASVLTCLALENCFTAAASAPDFETLLTQACQRAAGNLLEWAIDKGHAAKLRAGGDLMGTTLTAGWLEGNWLEVGNLGDSRVYLVNSLGAEQLTVDGDLGSALLSAGSPPENVVALGPMARALRECVGGCDVTPAGELTLAQQHNQPTMQRWPLLPGDIVILATDGLVEEGLFLAPADLLRIARERPERTAQELAVALADAADARQRLPSPAEPDGAGDNIGCVVIKIERRP